MAKHFLGEFQELVLLIVAALHQQAYGVAILKNLEKEWCTAAMLGSSAKIQLKIPEPSFNWKRASDCG